MAKIIWDCFFDNLKNKIRELIIDVERENCSACTYMQVVCSFDQSESCRRKALNRIIKSLHSLVDYIDKAGD